MTALTPAGLRIAGIADVAAIVALVERAYRGDASRAGWTSEADLIDGQRTDAAMISDIIADTRQVILQLEAPLLQACLNAVRENQQAYFGMIAVDPAAQAQGVGRQLLAAAEHFVVTHWHVSAVRMTVIRQRRELIAWYQRRGYVLTGNSSAFPYGNARFGLPLRDDLDMVELVKTLELTPRSVTSTP